MSWLKKYLPGFIRERLRERRRDKVVDRAVDLAQEGKYADAAEIYNAFAVESREESDLMSALYYRYSFEMWLKAKDARRAVANARSSLAMLCQDDGAWLKYDSGSNADDVIAMASQLYAAGFHREGDELSTAANVEFEKYGLAVRCTAEPEFRNEFPSVCPQCAGQLPYSPFARSIPCPFCDTAVYPANTG